MEEELLSGPVAPQATSEKMLQILSGLAPRDPAAANPATTAAMARARDAITRTLQRQMARQEEPFSGINDVATAAITALTSRHKTPFGSALAKLDADRDNSTIRTASALGQQAQRESKTGIDPIKAANLVMRHIEQGARNGDRDSREVDSFVKTLSSNMEPASAMRFQTSYGKALAEYMNQTGRTNLEVPEIKMLLSDFAQRGGFQTKLPNLTFDAWGRPQNPNPYRGGGGGAPPPPAGREDPATALRNLPPAGTPQPGENAGPTLAPNAPGGAERALAGRATPSQIGGENVKQYERQKLASAFSQVADATLRDASAAGSAAMGPLGWLSRTGGAAIEQIGAAGFGPEFSSMMRNYAPMVDGIVQMGAQSAGVKAGIMSVAYLYGKAMDDNGRLSDYDVKIAISTLGEAQGSVEQLRAALDVLKRNVAIKLSGGQAPQQGLPGNAGDLSKLSDDEVLRRLGIR